MEKQQIELYLGLPPHDHTPEAHYTPGRSWAGLLKAEAFLLLMPDHCITLYSKVWLVVSAVLIRILFWLTWIFCDTKRWWINCARDNSSQYWRIRGGRKEVKWNRAWTEGFDRAMQQEDDHQPVLFAHSLMFWQGKLCFHPSASI